jgi:hypothetical protein
MIVFFLIALVFLLAKEWRQRNIIVALAVLTSIAASFSSLQGLLLWPVGLICLLWERPRGRRRNFECGTWLLFSALTTATYFWGFKFQATGATPGFALHHPFGMAKFLLAALGNVIPTTNTDLRAHELFGLAVCIVAAFVVFRSLRDRSSQFRNPLPVTLIAFGALFDVSIVFGRISSGITEALSTRYTMANLLLLTGIVAYVWTQVPQPRGVRRRVRRFTVARSVGLLVLTAFLVVQVAAATKYGIVTGRTTRQNRIIGAQTVVNLDRIPSSERHQLIYSYVYYNVAGLAPMLREAKEDHLSVFAPGPYRFYRSKGPPSS